ncbi:MAG: acyl-CoA thioesterase [Armatimonadetes bacterium]|nr:acyl-CoA thioesterase [Armatimonadota bacterium]
METRTPSSTIVQMSELMTPGNANFLGKVFGGAILALLDKVAYVTASRFAGKICVTASFDRVDFHSPIEVGELVHMVGSVDFAGRTSVQTRIEVYAENIHEGTTRHTNSCIVTMVAIDDDGKPTPIPQLIAETREEKIRFLQGRARKEWAKTHVTDSLELLGKLESMDDAELDRLMQSDLRP